MVNFKDFDSFYSLLETAHENQQSFTLKSVDPSFISSSDVWQEYKNNEFQNISRSNDIVAITIRDDEKYLEKQVDFILIEKIANQNGLIKIADNYYKFTYEYIYIADETELQIILESNYSKLQKEPLIISRNLIDNFGSRADVAQCDVFYKNGSKNYKVSAEMSTINSLVYSEIRVNSKHRRKGWLGWYYVDAKEIWLNSSGTVSFQDPSGVVTLTNPFSVAEHAEDEAELHNLIQWCSNVICNFQFVNSSNTAKAKCLDSGNPLRQCTATVI